MAKIPIWPGSSSFEAGDTAFGFYDSDSNFITDAPLVAKWCANRLGYPLVDVELQETNFFSAFEEAITEYGHQLYTFQIINNLFRIKGNATGSEDGTPTPLNNIYLDDYYGASTSTGQGSVGSSEYTSGDQRLYSASLSVSQGRQNYNLLSDDPVKSTGNIVFSGEVAESQSISITDAFNTTVDFVGYHNTSSFIWPNISSSISSSANEFSASSAYTSAFTLMHAIQSGTFASTMNVEISSSDTNHTLFLTQVVEGIAGNTNISSSLDNTTVTSFTGGVSGLNFEQSGSHIQGGLKRIKIRKIYHYQPAAINRYFDPYAGTGTGIQSLMQAFGMGNYSPGVNFMLMPMYFDALKLQAIEMNDTIRKSAYHFELNAGKYLKLFPIPTSDYTLWFEYTMATSNLSPTQEESATGDGVTEKATNLITDISNAPYEKPTYSYINEPGRQWIRKYALALCKEMLGGIRGKYQSLPIPGAETTLDYARLLSEAVTEKENLITQLREDLEATTTLRQAERRTLESEQTQQQYTVNNPYQIYIH